MRHHKSWGTWNCSVFVIKEVLLLKQRQKMGAPQDDRKPHLTTQTLVEPMNWFVVGAGTHHATDSWSQLKPTPHGLSPSHLNSLCQKGITFVLRN